MEDKGIFHNGSSAKAFECNLILQNDVLHLYIDDDEKSLLIWSIGSFISCQYNGDKLLITYGNYPHQTLECAGNFASTIYSIWSGGKFIQKAEGFVFKGKGTAVITLIAGFVLVGVLIYFFLLPWVGEKSASLIPKDAEIELGNSIAEIYKQNGDENDSATYCINQFASKIKFNSEYDLRIHVIESDQINAFALPGGHIFVYSAIIKKMKSYEELVALLGHEATHVTKRHSLKSICRSMAGSFFIAVLFGDVTGISAGVFSQADQFQQLSYSRELETEADNNGYKIMIQNKVNPEGMLHLLQLLKEEGARVPDLMKYLSTHPDTDARIENIKSQLPKTGLSNESTQLDILFKKLKAIPKVDTNTKRKGC